jgi:hypothetical protein
MLIDASKGCPHLAKMDELAKDELVNKTIQTFVVNLKKNKSLKFEPNEIVDKFMRHGQDN